MLLQFALVVSLAALAGTGADGAKTTTTHIQFYMHDTLTVTTERVTMGTKPVLADPRYRFGDMYAMDDPLTEAPDAASPVVGRAQGLYIFASQTELALFLSFNMVFTAGLHNGSTIAVQSRNVITEKVRELPVVGGTGAFRGVPGHGLLRTHEFNVSSYRSVSINLEAMYKTINGA